MELRENATRKVALYDRAQCAYGIADCHETLSVGQYAYESPYAQKLWAEIDAMRERMAVLDKVYPRRGGVTLY